MQFNSKEKLVKMLRAGMDRFLGESAPFWSKETLLKLVSPVPFDAAVVVEALDELERNNDIYLIYDDEVYFIISEKFIAESFGPGNSFGDIQTKAVERLKAKFHK